jgi:glutathione S-transferase
MSMKLYYSPGACSFVAHAMLEMSGIPFEPVWVKLHKNEQHEPAYKTINPRSQVPVLTIDDLPLTQLMAIVGYLDAKFPEQNFLPREPLARAKALSTLAWMNNTAHPTFTHVFRPHFFAASEAGMAEVKAHNTTRYLGMLQELEALAAQAKPWISGAGPGPVDFYALVLMRWGGFAGQDPTQLPALWAMANKLASLPAVARVIEREKLQLNVYQPPAAKVA